MSADRLREAARVLRERGEAAPAAPWYEYRLDYAPSGDDPKWIVDSPARFICDTGGDHEGCEQVATYIATMHPGVALALADWLDYRAGFCKAEGVPSGPYDLAVADLILGGAS